jgi:hypothetical protein
VANAVAGHQFGRRVAVAALVLAVAACGSAPPSAPASGAVVTPAPVATPAVETQAPSEVTLPATTPPTVSPSESQPPDAGGGTSAGDVPDNAVFLTYHGTNPSFSIQYVEGWQVSQEPEGVAIRDKDSSETVAIVAAQADVPAYVASADLPFLQTQPGFKLVQQDTVKVGSSRYVHLVYHLPAPPDPVTGKQVPSTVDRYYVPGPNGLAVVSLSTPAGVDNVDAFRQMIESFRWS